MGGEGIGIALPETPLHFGSVLEAVRLHGHAGAALRVVDRQGRVTREVSYDELRSRIDRCAAAIAGATEPGEILLLIEPDVPAFIAWFLGCLTAGRYVLPAPADTPSHELARWIAESGAACGMGDGVSRIAGVHGLRSVPVGATKGQANPTEGGIVLRTSGTTGIPKLVQRNIASLDAVASNVRNSASLGPGDVVLAAIPVWHSYGIENAMLAPLAAGATVILCEFEPGLCERLLMDGRVSVFPGVPTMFESLSRGAVLPGGGSLRLAYSAGSQLPSEVAAAFSARWSRAVGQLYGATDVGSVTFGDPAAPGFVPDAVGTPMPGVSVRIIRDDGDDAETGEEGQIAIRAPSMLTRYLGDHPMDMVDGHLLMGDLGRLDDARRLTITGMMKFLIDVGGMKVNPLEVEGVLRGHPRVADCAVVPIRVSASISRVRAIIVPTNENDPPEPAGLRAWARERLAGHKVPRIVDVRDSLPRSATGKLLRRSFEEA